MGPVLVGVSRTQTCAGSGADSRRAKEAIGTARRRSVAWPPRPIAKCSPVLTNQSTRQKTRQAANGAARRRIMVNFVVMLAGVMIAHGLIVQVVPTSSRKWHQIAHCSLCRHVRSKYDRTGSLGGRRPIPDQQRESRDSEEELQQMCRYRRHDQFSFVGDEGVQSIGPSKPKQGVDKGVHAALKGCRRRQIQSTSRRQPLPNSCNVATKWARFRVGTAARSNGYSRSCRSFDMVIMYIIHRFIFSEYRALSNLHFDLYWYPGHLGTECPGRFRGHCYGSAQAPLCYFRRDVDLRVCALSKRRIPSTRA